MVYRLFGSWPPKMKQKWTESQKSRHKLVKQGEMHVFLIHLFIIVCLLLCLIGTPSGTTHCINSSTKTIFLNFNKPEEVQLSRISLGKFFWENKFFFPFPTCLESQKCINFVHIYSFLLGVTSSINLQVAGQQDWHTPVIQSVLKWLNSTSSFCSKSLYPIGHCKLYHIS